jgi:hypothetical protein
MSDFLIYLGLGFDHITDPRGYDHILFVIALCAIYTLRQWRQVLILVTAFTIGHSITLALATLRVIEYRTDVVELLIPVTILITAVVNFFHNDKPSRFALRKPKERSWSRYGLAAVFGLIHGLGFSNYLRSLLGRESDIVPPLLAFNIGLELGQLVIVGLVLTVSWVGVEQMRITKRTWTLIVSGMVAGMAISLILGNKLVAGE